MPDSNHNAETPILSPEYRAYLERRRVDIAQVLEATFAYMPPEALDENHLVDTLAAEFGYLSEELEMPSLLEMIDRWVAAQEARGAE